jgi:hypothetical protein
MKPLFKGLVTPLIVAGLLLLPACVAPLVVSQPAIDDSDYYGEAEDSDDPYVSYEDIGGLADPYDYYFHVRLHRWGEWIYLPGFGYVWRPWVVRDWMPYSVGYWAWTAEDWLWISYEPFGYIVYHFGNWAYLQRYGWCWFPGRVWAPHHVRWVEWEGHVGWHPIPPRVSIHLDFDLHWRRHVWVSRGHFLDRDLSRRRVAEPWRRWLRGEPREVPYVHTLPRANVERWTGRRPFQVQREEMKRQTRRGEVRVFVPDRSTREKVRREGSKIARPWLAPKQPKKQDKPSSGRSKGRED